MNEPSVDLLARWRAGDEDAATALFQRYAERLVRLAHSRLSARLATRVAPEDVVQSVYGSFFTAARNGRFALERTGDLWRLLVTMTLHKLHYHVRRHRTDKRAVDQEQQLDDLAAHAPDRAPLPEEALALTELVQNLLAALEPLHRRMIELRLHGHSVADIASDTQRTERTVRRVLEHVKDQLHRDLAKASAPEK